MDCERMDSLDGWVAIRPNVFEENEKFKLGFIVEWNVIESKFAVTCHNRTLQRQQKKSELSGLDTQTSWAGLFSVCDLKNVHRQLTSVNDVLQQCFPSLSEFEGGNIWDVLFLTKAAGNSAENPVRDLDSPCRQLEKYFNAAIDVCGRKIVLDCLFAQDDRDVEEYFENLHEFKQKSLEEQVARTKEDLRQIIRCHKTADKMVALLKIYEEEDEAYQELVTVATQFYQYLLQPFRDMRELAMLYKMEILKSLEFDDLGPKRIEALQKEADEWRKQAEDAVCSIQDITVNYFVETSKALAGMHKQMVEDKKRFGQASWASAAPRLEKVKFMLAKETLQHMRAKDMCLNRKKADIRNSMESLADQKDSVEAVDKLEMQYYEAQLELYDVKFEILKNEEMLLLAQLDTVRRQIKEMKEEVVYYDTCENLDELLTAEQTGGLRDTTSSEMKTLHRRLQQLEAQRGGICSRRAYLRNKKDQCVEAHQLKHRQAKDSTVRFQQHHSIQMKREQNRDEDRKKKEWVDQERQKTLHRLKAFREKCPASLVLKAPCSQAAAIKTTKKPKKNKGGQNKQNDIPVQIFLPPGSPPQPGETPPPPLPPALSTPSHLQPDGPRPLICERPQAPDSTKNSLKQNIGSMDEVLASLKRGQILLKKVEQPDQAATNRPADIRDSILSAIRHGVALKKIKRVPNRDTNKQSGNELERSIKAAMQRMKNVSSDSDDEDRGDCQSGEWDS
ncbi:WHAMM protein, partial [Polyodon spathula]|nr:WHAMM protein [Polyodon spathula]